MWSQGITSAARIQAKLVSQPEPSSPWRFVMLPAVEHKPSLTCQQARIISYSRYPSWSRQWNHCLNRPFTAFSSSSPNPEIVIKVTERSGKPIWERLIENELLLVLQVIKTVLLQRHWRKLVAPPFRKDLPWGDMGINTPLLTHQEKCCFHCLQAQAREGLFDISRSRWGTPVRKWPVTAKIRVRKASGQPWPELLR